MDFEKLTFNLKVSFVPATVACVRDLLYKLKVYKWFYLFFDVAYYCKYYLNFFGQWENKDYSYY